MARLTIRITSTGEEFEIEDVDLKRLTPHQLIGEMISCCYLLAEDIGLYGIVSKDGVKISDDALFLTFEQLGFANGDTIRIIIFTSGGGNDSETKCLTFDTCPKPNNFDVERLHMEEHRLENELSAIQLSYKEKDFAIEEEIEKIEIIQKEAQELLEMKQDALQQKINEYNQIIDEYTNIAAHVAGCIVGFDTLENVKKARLKLELLQQQIERIHDQIQKITRQHEYRISRCVEGLEELISEKEKRVLQLDTLRNELEAKQQEIERIEKERNAYANVYSSVFAPSEVKCKSHMIVQVYLHLFEETESVKALAQEAQKDAERRDYIPLQCELKKGDKVDIQLSIYGETLLMSDKKSVVWQGSFTKCSFDFFVSKDIDVEELSCTTLLTINDIPVGEMRFVTSIVETPRKLNPEIIAHKYNKVFISYSHLDESKVKFLHEGLELGAVPHFFDRKYLKAGDVFPQVIRDYINSADLFILCWSENASKSDYVQKERKQALGRAFPQVQPEKAAKLRIYPMSIEPRAELPIDMKDNYHFGEV